MIEALPLDLLYPVAAIAGTAILSALAGRAWGRRTGSSPHAWGTPERVARPSDRYRFIPTRMGNTSVTSSEILQDSVHPHTHGEHEVSARQTRQ